MRLRLLVFILLVQLGSTTFLVFDVFATNEFSTTLQAAAQNAGIPPALFAALVQHESGFNPNTISSGGCVGLGQICANSANPDYIRIMCNQSGGPHYCDRTNCSGDSDEPQWCQRCVSSAGSNCVPDDRYDPTKNLYSSATTMASKVRQVISAGCDINTEAGVKAAIYSYNMGAGRLEQAIETVGCSDYGILYDQVYRDFQPLSCTDSQCNGTCGTHPDFVGNELCLRNNELYGRLYGHSPISIEKLKRKSNEPGTYVTNIYNSYLSFGGITTAPQLQTIRLQNVTPVYTNNAVPQTIFPSVQGAPPIAVPKVRIAIPGLRFTAIDTNQRSEQHTAQGVFSSLPFISEYISAVYRYAIAVSTIIVAIVIIASGIQWILSGGGESATEAKGRIVHAIIGLILLAASYLLLFTINPKLVQFEPTQVLYVEGQNLTNDHSATQNTTNPPPSATYIPCDPNEALQHRSRKNYLGESDATFLNINDCYFQSSYTANRSIDKIVLHEGSDSVQATLNAWSRGFERSGGEWTISAHYIIDRDGRIYQVLGEEFQGIHAGELNTGSIGVDLVIPSGCRQSAEYEYFYTCAFYTDEQYAALNLLINDVFLRYQLIRSKNTIVPHGRVAHADPRNFDFSRLQLNNADFWETWQPIPIRIVCSTDSQCADHTILNRAGYELNTSIASDCLEEIGMCGQYFGQEFKR